MATVHVGCLLGPEGFSRTVAVKRLRPQFAKDAEFRSMFLEEARLAVRIRHPNVAAIVDAIIEGEELLLVMEYVHGESLGRLIRTTRAAGKLISPDVAASVLGGVLRGLHAAHEARDESGHLLGIVHRDVSPQNIVVGADGVSRVVDFGIAKAATSAIATKHGQLKGKLGYMAPEQIRGRKASPASDVFAAGVVLWETLTCRRLFAGRSESEVVDKVLACRVEPPSTHAPGVPTALDRVVVRALARDPSERFLSAKEMARALDAALGAAAPPRVTAWLDEVASSDLARRAEVVVAAERAAIAFAAQRRTRRLTSAAYSRLRVALVVLAALVVVAFAFGMRARSRPHPVASPEATPPPIDPVFEGPIRESPSSTEPPRPVPKVPHVAVPSRRPRPPRAAASCDPPYRVDANGQRHFKAECL